jgi:hypothetical protein
VRDNVHYTDELGHFLGRDKAGEDKMLFEAERARAILEACAPLAIAYEEKLKFGHLANERRSHSEKVVVTLEFKEPGDFADNDVVRGEAKSGANSKVVSGRNERFQGKTAQDFGIGGRLTDARSQILLAHSVRYNDKVSGDTSRIALGLTEDKISHGTLELTERGPVNRMDDDRHADAGGGEAAKNPRFTAMRMDDFGFKRPEKGRKAAQREPIFQRVNGPNQRGYDGEQASAIGYR